MNKTTRTDDAVINEMSNYIIQNHYENIDAQSKKCPYKFDDPDTDSMASHIWGSFVATMPNTTVRIMDYYAANYVKGPIAEKIRRATELIIGVFDVISVDQHQGKFVLQKDGIKYDAVCGLFVSNMLKPGKTYICGIHPWEKDNVHNIAFVTNTRLDSLRYLK